MENEMINCIDCKENFELTIGWIKLLEQHPDWDKPKRCYTCRKKRKEEKEKQNSSFE